MQTNTDVAELLQPGSGIIRSEPKVRSAITNAQCMQRLQRQHGTFARYMWSFLPQGRPIVNGFTCAANFAQAQPFCEMHTTYRAANEKAVNGMCALTSCEGIHLHLHETGRSALARICIIQGPAPDCMHSKREKMGCIASACRLQSQKPVTSDKAAEISAALKKEGFKFVGPIMMYEVMKVCHVQSCFNLSMCNVRCDCLYIHNATYPPVIVCFGAHTNLIHTQFVSTSCWSVGAVHM